MISVKPFRVVCGIHRSNNAVASSVAKLPCLIPSSSGRGAILHVTGSSIVAQITREVMLPVTGQCKEVFQTA